MLYRAIGLVLDSIHRLVCGRQKKSLDQWLRLALSNGPNWVGLSYPIHLRTETDPVSETLWYFLSSTYKTMDKVQKKPNSSVEYSISKFLDFYFLVNFIYIVCSVTTHKRPLFFLEFSIFWWCKLFLCLLFSVKFFFLTNSFPFVLLLHGSLLQISKAKLNRTRLTQRWGKGKHNCIWENSSDGGSTHCNVMYTYIVWQETCRVIKGQNLSHALLTEQQRSEILLLQAGVKKYQIL
jgi:hypothetical protein